MIKELSRQDIEDILVGATLFGAGGGGELAEGFELIDEAIAAGKTFRLASLDDVPDEALLATTYLLGAISDLPEGAEALAGGTTRPILLAYRKIAQYFSERRFGTLACELGGSNTAVPFYVAAMEDAVVIDADPAGRAVPEVTHSTFYLAGLPASPIVAANARGEIAALDDVADDKRAEELLRAFCAVSDNDIAAIDHVLPAAQLRSALIPGTLSRSARLGAICRENRDRPSELPEKLAAAGNGRVVFAGEVFASSSRNEEGFTYGSFTIHGHDSYRGRTFKIDLKNENLIGWLDGMPYVTIPEIITVLDTKTGAVVTNPSASVGQQVAVLVFPAPDPFLTAAGLGIFGPGYAGLDIEFTSVLGSERP